MGTIVSVHSFRRGVGRTSLVANLGIMLALEGYKVAVVDTDFQSPDLHISLGLKDKEISSTLNSFIWYESNIPQTVYNVTRHLEIPPPGKLFVIPASPQADQIVRMLNSHPNIERLNLGISQLETNIEPDWILLDSVSGLNEYTLNSIALSNILIILLRPDQQDYQGTAVTVEIARDLRVSRILMALNETPIGFDYEQAKQELTQTYKCEVGALLPHSVKLFALDDQPSRTKDSQKDPYKQELTKLLNHLTTDQMK